MDSGYIQEFPASAAHDAECEHFREAALLAAEVQTQWEIIDRLTEAATNLLTLKDGPRDDHYRRHKPHAWAQLRAAVESVDNPPEE